MIRVAWGFVYVLFIVVVSCMIPAIMLPAFQSYGLYARDVVGFSVFLVAIADAILLAFGILIWTELS